MASDLPLIQRATRRARRLWWGLTDTSFRPVMRYLKTAPTRDLPAPIHYEHPPMVPDALRQEIGKQPEITRQIFQTWKSREVIPGNYRYWRSSFIRQNPGYKVILWDDDDNRRFIYEFFPWFAESYEKYPQEIFRADAVRPFFLFLLGGFYADMDSECLNSLDVHRGEADVLLGQMGPDLSFNHSIPNALMASRPFQAFWLIFISLMQERAAATSREMMLEKRPEWLTGPVLLYDAYHIHLANGEERQRRIAEVTAKLPPQWAAMVEDGDVKLLGPKIWYGIDWTNPVHRKLRDNILKRQQPLSQDDAQAIFPDATMVTYWSHSW